MIALNACDDCELGAEVAPLRYGAGVPGATSLLHCDWSTSTSFVEW